MLYVPFLAEKNGYKNSQQGDHKCASGGGGGGGRREYGQRP